MTKNSKLIGAAAVLAMSLCIAPCAVQATLDTTVKSTSLSPADSSSYGGGGDKDKDKDKDHGGPTPPNNSPCPVPEMNALFPVAALAVAVVATQVWRKRREAGEQA
jgi:hypothetical protein